MRRLVWKYIAILLLLSSCDSGCIDSTSTGTMAVRTYNLNPAPLYSSEVTGQLVLNEGFVVTPAICTDNAKKDNPIENSLQDYWFDTGIAYESSGYTYDADASGSAFFCGAPNNALIKAPVYTFDYLNSNFIPKGGALKLPASDLSDGIEIDMWYDEVLNMNLKADDYLNGTLCDGKIGRLYTDANEGAGGVTDYQNLTKRSVVSSVLDNNTATSVVVPKGCVITLYDNSDGTGDSAHFAYPTNSEWLDYYAYDLRDPIFSTGTVKRSDECSKVYDTYSAANCIKALSVTAIDPSVEGISGSGDACQVRLLNNNYASSSGDFVRFADTGNDRYFSVDVGNSNTVGGDLRRTGSDRTDSDHILVSRNCEVGIYLDLYSATEDPDLTIKHPADYDATDHPFGFDPEQYISYYLRTVHSSSDFGGLHGANIADGDGRIVDKDDNNNLDNQASGYIMEDDPSWAGVADIMYPTLDHDEQGIRFDGVNDVMRITKDQYPAFLNYFANSYTIYFYVKPIAKSSGLHTIYSVVEGTSYSNQKLGDQLFIDTDDHLYFADDSDVYLLDSSTNFFDGDAHEILLIREDEKVTIIIDGDYNDAQEVELLGRSNLSHSNSMRSFILGNIVAWDAETKLENLIDGVGLSGVIKDFQIFEGALNREQQVDFVTEQSSKWGRFSCEAVGNIGDIRMKIGGYISDEPVFDENGDFAIPDLNTFFGYDSNNNLVNPESADALNGESISFHVSDPVVDMCTNGSNDEVKEEYANNMGNIVLIFRRIANGGGNLIGNLYEVIVEPIEKVLGQDLFRAFYDRVVGNCDSGSCTSPLFKRLLYFCLALYITFTGISLLFGLEKINKYELMRRIVLIGVITTLFSARGWNYFNFFIIYFFQNGALDIAQLIANSVFGFSSEYSTYVNGVIHRGDDFGGVFMPLAMVSEIIISEEIHMKILSLLFTPPFIGFIMILMIYYSFYIFFGVAFNVMLAYITILVIVAVGIIIAPFFFLLLLFKMTSSFFEKWLSLMVAAAMQLIVLSVTITFFSWVIYAFLISSFNYAVCWDTVWQCCNNVPGVDITLLEFFVPSGFSMMLGRFGYENIVSSAPNFDTVAILVVLMMTFDRFVIFSMVLGKNLGGGGGVVGVGNMVEGMSSNFSYKNMMNKFGSAANELSGGGYSRAVQSMRQNVYNNTLGAFDRGVSSAAAKVGMDMQTDKQKKMNKQISSTIKNAKLEMAMQNVTDSKTRDQKIESSVRSAMNKAGASEAQIQKALKSKRYQADKSSGLSKKQMDSFASKKTAKGRDEVQSALANEANRIEANYQQDIASGKTRDEAEKRAQAETKKVARSFAKAERTDKSNRRASKAAKSSNPFARTASAVSSSINDGAASAFGDGKGGMSKEAKNIKRKLDGMRKNSKSDD